MREPDARDSVTVLKERSLPAGATLCRSNASLPGRDQEGRTGVLPFFISSSCRRFLRILFKGGSVFDAGNGERDVCGTADGGRRKTIKQGFGCAETTPAGPFIWRGWYIIIEYGLHILFIDALAGEKSLFPGKSYLWEDDIRQLFHLCSGTA